MARIKCPARYAASALDPWRRALLSLPDMAKQAPRPMAKYLKSKLDQAISDGRSVDGKTHAPLKSGKGKALQGAQHDVTVTAKAKSVLIRFVGGLVYSEYGTGRQVARPLMAWSGGLPPKLGNAIRLGLVAMTKEWLERGGSHKGPGQFRGT